MDPKLKAEIIEQLKALDQANKALFKLVKMVPKVNDFSYSLEQVDEAVQDIMDEAIGECIYCGTKFSSIGAECNCE